MMQNKTKKCSNFLLNHKFFFRNKETINNGKFFFQKMTSKNISTTNDNDGFESVLGDDDEFQEAALFVQNNLSLFSRDDLLYLYARFKQVTVFNYMQSI